MEQQGFRTLIFHTVPEHEFWVHWTCFRDFDINVIEDDRLQQQDACTQPHAEGRATLLSTFFSHSFVRDADVTCPRDQ